MQRKQISNAKRTNGEHKAASNESRERKRDASAEKVKKVNQQNERDM